MPPCAERQRCEESRHDPPKGAPGHCPVRLECTPSRSGATNSILTITGAALDHVSGLPGWRTDGGVAVAPSPSGLADEADQGPLDPYLRPADYGGRALDYVR